MPTCLASPLLLPFVAVVQPDAPGVPGPSGRFKTLIGATAEGDPPASALAPEVRIVDENSIGLFGLGWYISETFDVFSKPLAFADICSTRCNLNTSITRS